MAYRNLEITTAPRYVRQLIVHLEDHYFKDVHGMFRLPIPNYRVTTGCNFAIAQILLAVISGLSVTLYQGAGKSGAKFKGLLTAHYQWFREPPTALTGPAAAEAIYSVFRNPLTHDLGLGLTKKATTASIKVKKYARCNGTRGLTERDIDMREDTSARPNMSGTVTGTDKSTVLLVDALYWGTRAMIEAMVKDAALMASAESYLSTL